MIKQVLFDLDGTLLPMNNEEFAKTYFHYLGSHVKEVMEPKVVIEQLLTATTLMVKDKDSSLTNEEVFMKHFTAGLGAQADRVVARIMDFYENAFWQLRKVTRPAVAARQAVEIVLQRGGVAVIATNPIFPRLATQQRLVWAGLESYAFPLVTVYENSHFCKPNPDYYQEIIDRMGWRAEECLMVGNDVEEDLIAGCLGIKTCLVTDDLINDKQLAVQADYVTTRQELPLLLERIL
ncbi:HAD family hydrolase [Azotosporobacter soli]|uniref:HAD family hydrolase n=1 Tax=Azotosporobacter soli TaxID=3055040 RepID=UPI0031FE725D